MRRLGFLEILICDCASQQRMTQQSLGDLLWDSVSDKQDKWLRELGRARRLRKEEVGKITLKIAGRFVKLAVELGLLTDGPLKALTDLGKLFKLFRKQQFFVGSNVGQQIILVREFLRKDVLIFPKIVGYIVKEGSSSTSKVFDWFASDFIGDTLKSSEYLDDRLRQRFISTMNAFSSKETGSMRRGYDKVKHIITPRLENIVDLEIISKQDGPVYISSDRTAMIFQDLCQPIIRQRELSNEEMMYKLAKFYGASKGAGTVTALRRTLLGFDSLAEPPLKVVPTQVLEDYVCIDSIVSEKSLILPSKVEEIERFLSKKFYGKVVFFQNMEGQMSHISIRDEVREKVLANLDEYASQIGE